MDNQTTIFEMLYETYKVKKPIRLIEMFSGYGSQALALKYLGVEFEHWKICEWAIKSIQAYKDIHFTDNHIDYSQGMIKEWIAQWLYTKGISSNYNEPMTLEQINRLNEKQLRTIYNNIFATHNLVNIQQVKAEDLEIVDTDKYDYILTYSFPCQDLSLAGKCKGMSDTSTRSGMLWEVERILTECKELGTLPSVLLMENVPMIHSVENTKDFNKWQLRLEELGYKNYWQDLIATDYGIPQTRNRCFMISILGDYNYTFPKPIPLKLKLKDMLEDNVDERFYLDDKEYSFILNNIKNDSKNYLEYERYNNHFEQLCRVWKEKSPSLHTKSSQIKNFDKRKYIGTFEYAQSNTLRPTLESRTHINSKTSGSLLSSGNQNGILVKNATKKGYLEEIDGYGKGVVLNDLRIRKLTPRECFRLMGVKDEDYDKVKKNQSDNSLYHLAGDSIVVNVLMAIFKEIIF